ncbi:MAG TPA: putative sugar nucleotidyl transferase [Candidatus Kapabacteria bacterium]|nr:putative sugar nucleotidyl transferase [Candidatus Kapabacteria bacterium]
MLSNLILFENERIDDLYPFNLMHCSWELKTGIYQNFSRIMKLASIKNCYFIGRELQLKSFLTRFEVANQATVLNNVLMIDGSVSLTNDIFNEIKEHLDSNENIIFRSSGVDFAYYLQRIDFENINFTNFKQELEHNFTNNFISIDIENVVSANFLWDTLAHVSKFISEDIKISKKHNLFYPAAYHNVNATDPNNIYLGDNVKIAPSVYLDSRKGPIVLGDNVEIMGLAGIIGPTYIGNNSLIKMGAKIYENNLIGEWCKVGGEVENTIIHAYSNKQHEGFLGHSYIGEWVNLGADTNNSDLKNTYSNIKMRLPHKTVNSGLLMLGLMCGDHSKSAINTQFNTGTVVGISSILFDSGFLLTTIPSFSYGGKNQAKKYTLDEAIETARIMMARRRKILSNEEINILKYYYYEE